MNTPESLWTDINKIVEAQQSKRRVVLGTERATQRPFYLTVEERQLHTLLLGRTGTGKTTVMENMIMNDIKAGEGVCVIDIHGDLISSLIPKIPLWRQCDIILFDPSKKDTAALNILEAESEDEIHYTVEEMTNFMSRFWDPHQTGIVGPQFEQAVRYAMLTIMFSERKGGTLFDLPSVISSTGARDMFMDRIKSSQQKSLVSYFWEQEWGQKTHHNLAEILCFVTSKFERFRTNEAVKKLLCASRSTFRIDKALDEGKILLIRIPKGVIEDLCARFIGSMILLKIFAQALKRSGTDIDRRRPSYLYIDEFQSFSHENIRMLTAEARKFKLFLTLATQNLRALDEDILESVLGNVSNLVIFRTGFPDAQRIVSYLMPYFKEHDLINLPNYHAVVKTAEISSITYPTVIKTIEQSPCKNSMYLF